MTFARWRKPLRKWRGDGKQRRGSRSDYRVRHQPSVAIVVFSPFGSVARVNASQEFAEDTLLGLAECVAEISRPVRVVGEPGKPRSATAPTFRILRSGSCFSGHYGSNRGTVFAGSQR